MQNKNIIVGLFSMLVVVIFGIGYSYADDVYNYESVISTSDWSNMNHAERVEKLSIPNEYIQNMTTTELLNSVLAYPYFTQEHQLWQLHRIGTTVMDLHGHKVHLFG